MAVPEAFAPRTRLAKEKNLYNGHVCGFQGIFMGSRVGEEKNASKRASFSPTSAVEPT